MKKSSKITPADGKTLPSIAERYFAFLGTTYKTADAETKQPAPNRYIDILRSVQQDYTPRYDLNACLAGTDTRFKGRVWFWSDLHFFHQNIIRYCQRPFADMAEMNNALLTNCLERVTAADILVFGGDIAMGHVDATNALLRAIPSYKINILGNHDIQSKSKQLLQFAVDEVAACLELDYKGASLFLSHYPVSESTLAPGQWNMHGHIHNSPFPPNLGSGERHVNMCVEHTEFSPVSLDWLLARKHNESIKAAAGGK
jgi:calcineurin-like phosphoesterase family protein